VSRLDLAVEMKVKCNCACWIPGLLAVLIVCLVAGGQTQPSTAPAPGRVEFESRELGFRLQFPSNLRRLATRQPGVALVLMRQKADPRGTQAQITVLSPPNIRAGLNLHDTATAFIEGYKRLFSDPRVVEVADTTLAGEPARRYVLQGHEVQGGREMVLQIVVAQWNDKLYALTAMSEPAGTESWTVTFDDLLQSFRWTR
jgi:hypothetical protein